MSPNIHCRFPLSSVLSPMFTKRNAQMLSAAHRYRRRRKHIRIIHYVSYVWTHTQHHICISQQQREKCSWEYQFYSFRPQEVKKYASTLMVWICIIYVKQLSWQSGQSENYSNKDTVMVQFHYFNQTSEFEWILIEEARSQSHVPQWS